MDVGIGQHKIGWEKLDGVLTEDLVADHISHLVVDKAVGFFVAGLDNKALCCFNGLVYVDFLNNKIQ